MKFRLVLAAVLAVIVAILAGFAIAAAPAHAEAGYSSPDFRLYGSTSLACLDTSPQPNLSDRTQDTFACVGPAGTVQASGTLYQVVYVRYRRWISWGWVTFRCAPSPGPYDRYVGAYANLACSK